MCLLIQGNRRIAKEDIICYKVLAEWRNISTLKIASIVSLFHQNNKWELGVEQTAKRTVARWVKEQIEDGYFHSYKFEDSAYAARCFHHDDAVPNMTFGVYKCIIPKGSPYYYGIHSGGNEGYASKRLKVMEKIDTF